jgi:thiamine biosynthesis lipoprotein
MLGASGRMYRISAVTAATILTLAFLARPDEGVLVTETRPAMGTLATVTVAGAPRERAAAAIEAAFAVFERVEWSMNEWRADSPLSRLNAAAGEAAVALPGDLCEALLLAKDGAERTGGRFDPTWAALSDLYRFDGSQAALPPPALVRERCALVGHERLLVRRSGGGCVASLAERGMRVGLGGLAKGWALDAAARRLRALGERDFLLQAGGDLYAAGTRGGRPWEIAVRDPRGGPLDALATFAVSDRAFSTSGDYAQAFVASGRRVHHLLDPRTCEPATASRAVSVLARTAVEAEILGKALFVLGGADALRRAEDAGAEALVVTADGTLLLTAGLAALRRD